MVRSNRIQNKSFRRAFQLILFVVSVILAFFDIGALLNIITFLVSLFIVDANTITALVLPLTLVFGFSALAFLVFSFEYHARHFGTPASRKLFIYTLSAQVALCLAGCLVLEHAA